MPFLLCFFFFFFFVIAEDLMHVACLQNIPSSGIVLLSHDALRDLQWYCVFTKARDCVLLSTRILIIVRPMYSIVFLAATSVVGKHNIAFERQVQHKRAGKGMSIGAGAGGSMMMPAAAVAMGGLGLGGAGPSL
jgi:hypothetical protein